MILLSQQLVSRVRPCKVGGLSWGEKNISIFLISEPQNIGVDMKAEFTAIIEPSPEGGYWAICPEIPGANGQDETIEETKLSLQQAIELILEDRREDILRGWIT